MTDAEHLLVPHLIPGITLGVVLRVRCVHVHPAAGGAEARVVGHSPVCGIAAGAG